MKKINILYIDDSIDPILSEYLDHISAKDIKLKDESVKDINIEYQELTFTQELGYEGLVHSNEVKTANIIFIDSRLFVNNISIKEKFTGEQFKIILKRFFPFIEVFVITQNKIECGYQTLQKYEQKNNTNKSNLFYNENLLPKISQAINNIIEYRNIANLIKDDFCDDKDIIVQKILDSLEGTDVYSEFKKSDIDELIELFKELDGDMHA